MSRLLTDEQYAVIRRRRNEGYTVEDILAELRSEVPEVTRRQVSRALRAIRNGTAPLIKVRQKGTPYVHAGGKSVEPSSGAIADRAERELLKPRDLTAAMMGDPLPGYSALDRKSGGDARG